MSADSPVEAYREACECYLRTQEIEDWQERIERMREVQEKWAACFPRLMEMAATQDVEVWATLGDAYSKGWGTERNRELLVTGLN